MPTVNNRGRLFWVSAMRLDSSLSRRTVYVIGTYRWAARSTLWRRANAAPGKIPHVCPPKRRQAVESEGMSYRLPG
jgi:hypothetical protein